MHLKCPHCSTVLQVNSPGGTQVQCPSCQGLFVVPAATSAGASQVTPSITPKSPEQSSAPQTDPSQTAQPEEAAQGGIPWKLIERVVYAVIVGVLSAGVVFGIVVAYRFLTTPPQPIDNTPYVADGQANTGNVIQEVISAGETGQQHIKWIPAKNSATMQGFKVKIHHVDWGEVRGRDAGGSLIVSERPFIIVYLELANRSDKVFSFKSWYGNEFVTAGGAIRTAQLSDDNKSVYYPLRFDDLADLKWNTPEKTFEPLEEGTDSIVFDVPDDFDPAQLEHLYLDLPGEAVGLSGSYRFQIPRSMIQGI